VRVAFGAENNPFWKGEESLSKLLHSSLIPPCQNVKDKSLCRLFPYTLKPTKTRYTPVESYWIPHLFVPQNICSMNFIRYHHSINNKEMSISKSLAFGNNRETTVS
jgi:hypothetical protein